jgi:hypothetical protein
MFGNHHKRAGAKPEFDKKVSLKKVKLSVPWFCS